MAGAGARATSVPAIVKVTLPTLKPGSYKFKLTLTDGASAKQASVTLPFSIVRVGGFNQS